MSSKRERPKRYPLSEPQKVIFYQDIFGMLHPQSGNISMSVLLEKDTDPELLRRAIDVELERNDCLRLRMRLTLSGVRQSFLEKKRLGTIPTDDLSGATEEEFSAYVKANSAKPLRLFRGENFRLRFFRSPDGRLGIFGVFAHLATDASAVLLFYRDLLGVYCALRDGKELPPPLCRFEDALQRDFAAFANAERMERTVRFYDDYLQTGGPSFYAGVDRMRELKRTREKLKKPDFRGVEIIHPLNDATETVRCHIDRETLSRMKAFCSEQNVSLQSLFQMGIRTHLSLVNEKAEDVCLFMTVSRRPTVADSNSGGTRALAHVHRTIFKGQETFTEALKTLDRVSMRLYRYPDYSSLTEARRQAVLDGMSPMYTTLSVMFTFLPEKALAMPEGIKCEFLGSGTGHFVYTQYTMIVPNLSDGGYDCYYQYQTRGITREDILLMHENMMKTVEAGISRPDITVGELLSEVL